MNALLVTIIVLLIVVATQWLKQFWIRVIALSTVIIMWSWVAHLQDLHDAKAINQYSFAVPIINSSIRHSATQQDWSTVSNKLNLVDKCFRQTVDPHLSSSMLLSAMDECLSIDAIADLKPENGKLWVEPNIHEKVRHIKLQSTIIENDNYEMMEIELPDMTLVDDRHVQ
jgi:hypothetical protein